MEGTAGGGVSADKTLATGGTIGIEIEVGDTRAAMRCLPLTATTLLIGDGHRAKALTRGCDSYPSVRRR